MMFTSDNGKLDVIGSGRDALEQAVRFVMRTASDTPYEAYAVSLTRKHGLAFYWHQREELVGGTERLSRLVVPHGPSEVLGLSLVYLGQPVTWESFEFPPEQAPFTGDGGTSKGWRLRAGYMALPDDLRDDFYCLLLVQPAWLWHSK